MNDAPIRGSPAEKHLLAALPLGFCLFDDSKAVVMMNDAFGTVLGLPGDLLRVGMTLADCMRVLAYQGIFGPGDPERQAQDAAHVEAGRPRRLRRSRPDGRAHELTLTALPDGITLATATEISTLLRQRDAAEERSARLSATIEAVRQGIALFDAGRTLLLNNRRFAELLALAPEALRPGLSFASLTDLLRAVADVDGFDHIAAPAQALVAQLADTPGAPQHCLRADGKVVEIGATRLAGGGWTVTAGELSPVAAADGQTQRRGRLLGGIFERLPQGVCVLGADGRVSMFNRAFAQYAHHAAVRIGDSWAALIRRLDEAGEYRDSTAGETAARLLALDLRQPQAWRRRRPDGTLIDVRLIPQPDGGTTCVVTDVTPPPATSDAARQAAAAAAILGGLRQGVMLWDRERRLVAANRAAATLIDLPDAMLAPGRRQHELLSAMADGGQFGEREALAASLRGLLARDGVESAVERLTGGKRRLEISSDPIPPDGFLWTCCDISERVEVENELRRVRAAAEGAGAAKSRFLATMSHELRTPLNVVIGFSETLAREANDRAEPGRIAEFATAINDAGKQLLTLINNILDVARIESGRFDLATDRIELPHLVAACVRAASAAARSAQLTLQTDIPRELPPLRGDERRLRQVLSHLIGNAIKFTEPGGWVRIAATRPPGAGGTEGGLLLTISDNGIGIPDTEMERVFEPFTQIDNGFNRRAAGSGLGLYFARALIAAHGGDLTLASRPGKGTTATIRLPRSRLIDPQPIDPAMTSRAGLQEHR